MGLGTKDSHSGIRIWPSPSLFLLLGGFFWAQSHSGAPPQFENYRASEIFTGTPVAPKLVTRREQLYADQIRDGVEKGYGALRDGQEQIGPNFAGHLVVIQWGCGAPCMRMAIVDARTGDVYYPPISINGVGARSFDLPLLIIGDSVSQNSQVQFRLNSNLMIIKATPNQSGRHLSYTYYFLWRQSGWTLLQKVALDRPKAQTIRARG